MNIPLLGKPSSIKKYNQLTTLLRKYCAYKSYVPALRSVRFNGDKITVYDLETHVTLNLETGINAAIEFDDLRKLGSALIDGYTVNTESTFRLTVTEKKDFDYLEVEESFEFKTRKEAEDYLVALEVRSSWIAQTDYLCLENNSGTVMLGAINQSEFPEEPDVGELYCEADWSLETLEQIGLVVAAAATDNSRPVFKGIGMSSKNGYLTAVCADGFMLLKNEIRADINFDIIVPALQFKKALEGFKRLKNNSIKVEVYDKWIRLTSETMVWTQRLIEDDFPDWKRIVPEKSAEAVDLTWNESCLRVVKEMLQAYPHLKKIGNPGVIFSDGVAEIQGDQAYIPTRGQVEYKIDLEMEKGSFHLNPVMVKKMLEAFGETDGWYIYRESGVVNPVVFERIDLLGVIMPMRTEE